MGKYKTKAIQVDLGIFRHIQAYAARHIQAYSKPFLSLHIQTPGIFRTLTNSEPEAYSEPWFIQNPGIFRTRGIFRSLVYSEPWGVWWK